MQEEDSIQVVDRWIKAFTESDLETIVGLYAADASFLGTGSKTLLKKPEDIRGYFQATFVAPRQFIASIVESAITAASESAFVITALDRLVVAVDGRTQELFGRVTFVVAKREMDWKIVSFHRSSMPA